MPADVKQGRDRVPARRVPLKTTALKAVAPTIEPEEDTVPDTKAELVIVEPPTQIKLLSPEEFKQLPVRLSRNGSKWEPFLAALEGQPAGTAVKVGDYTDEDSQRRIRNSLTSVRRVNDGEFRVRARNGGMFLIVPAGDED